MQFRKNTRPALSSYLSRYIIKISIVAIVIYGVFLLIDRIKFPSQIKLLKNKCQMKILKSLNNLFFFITIFIF